MHLCAGVFCLKKASKACFGSLNFGLVFHTPDYSILGLVVYFHIYIVDVNSERPRPVFIMEAHEPIDHLEATKILIRELYIVCVYSEIH